MTNPPYYYRPQRRCGHAPTLSRPSRLRAPCRRVPPGRPVTASCSRIHHAWHDNHYRDPTRRTRHHNTGREDGDRNTHAASTVTAAPRHARDERDRDPTHRTRDHGTRHEDRDRNSTRRTRDHDTQGAKSATATHAPHRRRRRPHAARAKTATATPRAAPATTTHRARRRRPRYPRAASASATTTRAVQQSAFALPGSRFRASQALAFPAAAASVPFT